MVAVASGVALVGSGDHGVAGCALVVGWMAVTEIGSRFRLLGKCRPHFWVSFFFIPVALSESLGLVVSQ